MFFDRSASMWKDRKRLFDNIPRLAVAGVSDWTANHAKESLLKSADMIKRVYNWIDLDLFKPHRTDMLRKKMGLEDKFVIFCISQRWSEQKGIDVIKELSELIPDGWRIVIAGALDKNIVLNDKCIKLGSISDTKLLSDCYAMADVFVSPSVQETFGKTMAEAMSCGTPVVAFESPCCAGP